MHVLSGVQVHLVRKLDSGYLEADVQCRSRQLQTYGWQYKRFDDRVEVGHSKHSGRGMQRNSK
jgi:hypothetical protein